MNRPNWHANNPSSFATKPGRSRVVGVAASLCLVAAACKTSTPAKMRSPVETVGFEAGEQTYILALGDPESRKTTTHDAQALFLAGQYEKAEKACRNRLKEDPGSVKFTLLLAKSLLMQKKYDLAYVYAQRASKKRINKAAAYNVMGLAEVLRFPDDSSRIAKGVGHLAMASKEDGKHVASVANLGTLQSHLGHIDKAVEHLQMAVGRCRRACTPLRMELAKAQARAGRLESAKTLLTKLSEEKPPYKLEALYRLGVLWRDGYQDVGEAEDWFSEVMDAATPSETKWRNKAKRALHSLRAG